MKRSTLDRILPRGPALLRRLALAEVLGTPPSARSRADAMGGAPPTVPAERTRPGEPAPQRDEEE